MKMEFHMFRRLPLELRCHIWRLSVDDAKYLRIHVSLDEDLGPYISDHRRFEDVLKWGKMKYRMEPWPVLQVCREARDALALLNDTSETPPLPPWLNWHEMTFVCDEEDVESFARDSWGAKVVNLTVTDCHVHSFGWPQTRPSTLDILLNQLPSLRKIVLLLPHAVFAVYGGKTFFWYSLFESMVDVVWGKEWPFEVTVGHEDVPEEEWLTRENHTEMVYYDEDSVKKEGSVQGLSVVDLIKPVRVKGEWRVKRERRKLFDEKLFM